MHQGIKNALVVEGGAMRGIFTTGVLDGFLDAQFNPFDLCIGVSSGAGNLAAYLAGMVGRNFKIYTDYSLRPEFINPARFLRGGHLMDLDWLWRTTIAQIRLDLETIYSRNTPFIVGLTDTKTGTPLYKDTDRENLESVLLASSAMPVFYRSFPLIDGHPYTDGGLADPIPVQEAIRRGARRIMVLRTRSASYRKKQGLLYSILLWKLKKFPSLRKTVEKQVERYNRTVELIRKPPRDVSITEICPPDTFRIARLTRNRQVLIEGYRQGRVMSAMAMRSWAQSQVAE